MIGGILEAARKPRALLRALRQLERRSERLAVLLGELHAHRIARIGEAKSLAEVEFRVFSQWGEDGILEYLVSRTLIPNEIFVEFGVEDYTEANTRFLLQRRNWTGLVIDSSKSNVRRIQKDPLSQMYDLKSVAAHVTAENIDSIMAAAGIRGDIGLLSVDVDGNDYWVWKAIASVSPRIVVCEYNAVLGDRHAITVPYDPAFDRARAHPSRLFFGASLPALTELAATKGYVFVGCGSAGVNAFFVRRDCADAFSALSGSARYVASKVRESRDSSGNSTFLSGAARLQAIAGCAVLDLRTGRTLRIGELDPYPGRS